MRLVRAITRVVAAILVCAAIGDGRPNSALSKPAANLVPFASKRNLIELVVLNQGERGARTVVESTTDVPAWIHFTATTDTLLLGLKDKQQIASFEFSVDPSAPVGEVTSVHFVVSAQGGGVWTKAVRISVQAPKKFALFQNYPNPFNPSTTISYDLPQESRVSLKIFDLLGREVATVVDAVQKAGHQEQTFDGAALSSGVYFYRIQTDRFVAVKKLMLLK